MKAYDPTKIKHLRELKGLSHKAFGEAIEKSRSWVILCEKGQAYPDVRDLDLIAMKFDVDQTSFWSKEDSLKKTS